MKERYRSLVAVYAMVINEQNEILLLRRTNTGYRDGFYDMPAGHLEEGETLREGTIRELEEETGLRANVGDLEFAGLLHRTSTDRVYIDVFFRIRSWEGNPTIRETDKCDHMDWFPLDAVPEQIVPHQYIAIEAPVSKAFFQELFEDR